MKSKSQTANIISIFLTKHRKLVYNLLSFSQSNVLMAVLKLLTDICMQGSIVAKEMLRTFDFTRKTFHVLVNQQDKKVLHITYCIHIYHF